nr:NDM metallo-beta-lactamase [uncultured bacterium]
MLRHLLPGLLMLTAASCAPAGQRSEVAAADAAGEWEGVAFRRIAPGVWLHSAFREVPGFGRTVSNGLVVENGETSVLVDTAWDDAQTRTILQWAREHLHRPVAAAVVTHAHSDKMGGMAALHSAGVKTFANRLTNADAPARDLIPAQIGLDFDTNGWLTPASAEAAADLGPLRVFYPGAGHTRDNIVVGLAQAKIIFGGCLIRPPGSTDMGNTGDGDLSHWDIAAQRAGDTFPGANVVVPSHGPPAGRELIALTARLAREARAEK